VVRGPGRGDEQFFKGVRTVDIDGDGLDEVIGEELRHAGDAMTERLVVLAVQHGEIVRLLDEPYEIRVDVAHRTGRAASLRRRTNLWCRSRYSITGGRIEIAKGVIEREPDVPAGETFEPASCAPAKRTFAWTAATGFAEVGVALADDARDPRCPSMRRMAALFGVKPGETVHEARCVPGRFPRPALLIVAQIADADELREARPGRRFLIVEGDRVIASHHAAEYVDVTGVFETHVVRAVGDLDGDGVDEIAVEFETATPMGASSTLFVFRVAGNTLRKLALTRPFHELRSPNFVPQSEHDAPTFDPATTLACDATAAIAARELTITRAIRRGAKVDAKHATGFCTGARERWRFDRRGTATELR
jgi:hypothetical protein